MKFLTIFLERGFEIGFLFLAFGIAVSIGSCAIRQKAQCPAIPDKENLMREFQKVIDKEFSK